MWEKFWMEMVVNLWTMKLLCLQPTCIYVCNAKRMEQIVSDPHVHTFFISLEVFTNSPQYKNTNNAICVFAVPLEIYWTTKVSNL